MADLAILQLNATGVCDMSQTELLMKIYKRLERANFTDPSFADLEEAAADIHDWLVEEIPEEIRTELTEEAFDEVGL